MELIKELDNIEKLKKANDRAKNFLDKWINDNFRSPKEILKIYTKEEINKTPIRRSYYSKQADDNFRFKTNYEWIVDKGGFYLITDKGLIHSKNWDTSQRFPIGRKITTEKVKGGYIVTITYQDNRNSSVRYTSREQQVMLRDNGTLTTVQYHLVQKQKIHDLGAYELYEFMSDGYANGHEHIAFLREKGTDKNVIEILFGCRSYYPHQKNEKTMISWTLRYDFRNIGKAEVDKLLKITAKALKIPFPILGPDFYKGNN